MIFMFFMNKYNINMKNAMNNLTSCMEILYLILDSHFCTNRKMHFILFFYIYFVEWPCKSIANSTVYFDFFIIYTKFFIVSIL